MKSRIEQLEEKLLNIQNLIGEVSFTETNRKTNNITNSIFKENLNNITEVIHKLQKEISENDSIALKEVHRKCISIFFIN